MPADTRDVDKFASDAIGHMPALRRLARLFVRDPADADDLVQETLERALLYQRHFQPDTNLRAWLFTILRTRAVTGARKEKIRRAFARDSLLPGPRSTPATQYDLIELQQCLQALKSLPAREQQAIVLMSIEDLTYEAASELSGLRVGTLKSRLSRGRVRLKALMDGRALQGSCAAIS